MAASRASIVILAFCLLLAFASASQKVGEVVKLTSENIDEIIDGKTHVLVMFGAKWCDHCTEMITEFRNVAFTYAAFSNVKVAKVNVDNEEALVKQFGVKRLPTILLFKAGSSRSDTIEYPLEAERTANDMVDFMNHYIGFEVESKKEHSSVIDYDTARLEGRDTSEKKYHFVMFHAPWCAHCHAVSPIWDRIATVFKGDSDVVISRIDVEKGNNYDLTEKYDIDAFPTIMVFGPHTENLHNGEAYDGNRDFLSLLRLVNHYAHKQRSVTGLFLATFGRDEEYDEEIEFFLTKPDERDTILSNVKARVAAIKDEDLQKQRQLYVDYMERVAESGNDWVIEEYARLTDFLYGEARATVNFRQRDEASLRYNVLAAFKEVLDENHAPLKKEQLLKFTEL